jgi:hypothetical protein
VAQKWHSYFYFSFETQGAIVVQLGGLVGADYKVAIEKCDALAGPAKHSSASSAKVQYGKSRDRRKGP